MKVKIDPKRNIKIFLIAFLVCGALLFLFCIYLFVFSGPWGASQYTIIAIFLVLSIALLIASFKANYYIINDTNFEVHRFGKTFVYDYKSVIYIDEEASIKSKTIAFMLKNSQTPRYLTFDKNGTLYQTMIEKCKDRLSKEQFIVSFPNIKF